MNMFICMFRRVKDHHNLLQGSPSLKNACIRRVVLDKWFPLTYVHICIIIYLYIRERHRERERYMYTSAYNNIILIITIITSLAYYG